MSTNKTDTKYYWVDDKGPLAFGIHLARVEHIAHLGMWWHDAVLKVGTLKDHWTVF